MVGTLCRDGLLVVGFGGDGTSEAGEIKGDGTSGTFEIEDGAGMGGVSAVEDARQGWLAVV
jgi:hypothetical protein